MLIENNFILFMILISLMSIFKYICWGIWQYIFAKKVVIKLKDAKMLSKIL